MEKILSLVWGQGQAAPEASAGIPPVMERSLTFRLRRRGASPCPICGEITASWFQAEWTGAQTMGTPGHRVELLPFDTAWPPFTEGLHGHQLFLSFFEKMRKNERNFRSG